MLDPAKDKDGNATSKERRFGEKRANTLLASLEKAKKSMPLHRWLFAMGIAQLGESASKEFSRLFKTIFDLPNSELLKKIAERGEKDTWIKEHPFRPKNKDEITKEEALRRKEIHAEYKPQIQELTKQLDKYQIASELGGVVARQVLNYFKSTAGEYVISQLRLLEITPTSDNFSPVPQKQDTSNQILTGKTFVITGTLSQPRDHFKNLIEQHGGKVTGSITKNTDYLLAGEKAGSKENKAKSLNISILSELQLFKKISL